jgi:hypothetical protein
MGQLVSIVVGGYVDHGESEQGVVKQLQTALQQRIL